MRRIATLALGMALLATPALAARRESASHRAVAEIAPARIAVGSQGSLPLFVSRDWSQPLPGVTRAVLVLHGRLRNAATYYHSALAAQAAAGEARTTAIMIAPQFLATRDVEAHHLSADALHWTLEGWEGGDPAVGPSPTSSFAALDAVLARLGDRRIFPDLQQVVIAGHSGGAQVVQRYAIASQADTALVRAGIAVRYVVANPSSYAYFSAERPLPAIAACPGFNDWKYGMDNRPAYLSEPNPAGLEQGYVARRVIYLLGTLDTDPNQTALDKSCMAEAQGAYRYARGHSYFTTMQRRDAGTPHHSLWDVPGVGHNGDQMLTSPCGLHALFDVPGCG
ncbi:alpha/beta hydrolase [Acidisphaera sp. L21]|uniref:alpha/beta hydrolase n=1 Tax=Acidisphaera sp. L21 TaxID=1641851 RepID=UPI00131BBAC6|nr:alpha/beta hydrolase [Acidisphaera sp. L21]